MEELFEKLEKSIWSDEFIDERLQNNFHGFRLVYVKDDKYLASQKLFYFSL